MKYAYEDLSPDQFEDLVIELCRFLFGMGVQGFAKGPDGGRDGKFSGTAEQIPSTREPWKGTTIIQAKHTNGINMSFSDLEFYSENNEKSVLRKELPRIKILRENNQLDNYILFSNRKLTANTEQKLRDLISRECNIPKQSVLLIGIENLEGYLKSFPDAAKNANINPLDSPLIVDPDELAEVIESLSEGFAEVPNPPVDRISYSEKCKKNKMSDWCAKNLWRKYLKHVESIKVFLANPENADLLSKYESAAEEFQFNVIAKRHDHNSFDEVMCYLRKLLFKRDPVLRRNQPLTMTVVFYMYWNCDLGENVDD